MKKKINESTGTLGSPGTKGYTGYLPSERYAKYRSDLARIIKKTTGYELVDLEPIVDDTIDEQHEETPKLDDTIDEQHVETTSEAGSWILAALSEDFGVPAIALSVSCRKYIYSNESFSRCDRFCQIFRQIEAILAIFRPFAIFHALDYVLQ